MPTVAVTRRQHDLDLRPGEVRQPLLLGRRVVPLGDVGDPGGAAPDRDLTPPPVDPVPDLLQPLPATGIAETGDAVQEGGLQRREIGPAVTEARRVLLRE